MLAYQYSLKSKHAHLNSNLKIGLVLNTTIKQTLVVIHRSEHIKANIKSLTEANKHEC